MFSAEENPYQLGLGQLGNSRIGISENSLRAKNYVEMQNYDYTLYRDTSAGLNLLSEGDLDFIVDDLFFTEYRANKLNIPVSIKGIVDDDHSVYTLILQSGMLQNELNYALSRIKKEELYSLRNKWIRIYPGSKYDKMVFSDSEIQWIRNHPEIPYRTNAESSPIFYKDGMNFVGIIPEIMDVLSDLTTIRFTPQKYGDFNEMIMVEPEDKGLPSPSGKTG